MRRIGSLLLALLLTAGCTPQGPAASLPPEVPPAASPAPTESVPSATDPTPAAFVYDKYSIDGYTTQYIKPDLALYRAVFDGVDQFEASVPISGPTPTEEEAAAVAAAVFARFEFSYLRGITLAPDGKSFSITYLPDYTKEQALAARDAFRQKVTWLLEEVVSPKNSPTENVVALYRYFSACTYNEGAQDVGCYGIMVSSEGICTGYAYALRYLLDQLGIPSHLAFSTDESHVWNLVELDGGYYHLDPTWESLSQSPKPSMDFFAMTDARRQQDFEGWYGSGNSNYPRYPLPPSARSALVSAAA